MTKHEYGGLGVGNMLLKTDIQVPELDPYEVANHYITSLYNQVWNLKYNLTGMTVGRPQAGKSMGTGTMGLLLDPLFWDNLEKMVVYDAKSFMTALNFVIKHKEFGRFIMWDEAGVGMPARQWYDISNRAISFAIQVAGVFRPIVWFVTQDMTYIDSQPRKLINTFFDISRSTNKYSLARVYNLTVNRKTGKMYFKYPRMITKEKMHLKINKGIKITKPPKEFITRYLEHSKPFKERITTMMEQRADEFEAGKIDKKEYSVAEIIQSVLDHKETYEGTTSDYGNRKFSSALIRHDFGLPTNLSTVIKLRAEQLANRKEGKKESELETEEDKSVEVEI